MPPVIGLDFDNTLIRYDALMHRLAVERGLIPADTPRHKRAIRDQIRRLPDGDIEWQKVQGAAYGPQLGQAELIEGVADFLHHCRWAQAAVHIISHKTEFAGYDATRTPLRPAALAWMRQQHFFDADGLGLTPAQVHFGATRDEKIDWIGRCGCTHFIDDLEETFAEPAFPAAVTQILFAPLPPQHPLPGVQVCADWTAIRTAVFGPAA